MDKRSKFDRFKLSFQYPIMFKRLNVVERKFPLPEKASFRDVCGFIVLGIRSKLIFSTVLFSTKEITKNLEHLFCKTENGLNLSLGIVLLTLTAPGLVLKLFSDGIPPFIKARMLGSVILSTVGTFFVALGLTAFPVLFGIGILSYSYALRETTYSQYTAYFRSGVFRAWAFGCVISNFIGGISMLLCTIYIKNMHTIMLLYLIAPLMEIIAFYFFIMSPVSIRVVVIERPEDEIDMNNTNLAFWQPAGMKHQFKNMQLWWKPVVFHGLVMWMSMFNLQGTFEALTLDGYSSQRAYHFLYSTYCAGSLLGAVIGLMLNTHHLWISVILEMCTTTAFLLQIFCQFTPINAVTFSLAFLEGSLVKFSYVCSMNYLIENIDHDHANVVAFNILSLLESIFSLPASGSAFALHKLLCDYWKC